MKKTMMILCLSALGLAAACNNSTQPAENKTEPAAESTRDSTKKVAYQCPMDCEKGKTYEQAGICPICEMDLEKK